MSSQLVCPVCGEIMPAASNFCGTCGYSFPKDENKRSKRSNDKNNKKPKISERERSRKLSPAERNEIIRLLEGRSGDDSQYRNFKKSEPSDDTLKELYLRMRDS